MMQCFAIWDLSWKPQVGNHLGTEPRQGNYRRRGGKGRTVLAATGPNLFAFEIGNEPDPFPHREIHRKKGYGDEDYVLEYRKFRDALRKSIPGIHFAGQRSFSWSLICIPIGDLFQLGG